MNVSSCACQTTADFTLAAKEQAASTLISGTYMLVSSTSAKTAYMQVKGKFVIGGPDREPVWEITAVTPIDANGNSLAGESESAQEAVYSALDSSLLLTSRDFPIALGPIAPGQAPSAIPSFFTASDDDIWQGVVFDSTKNDLNFFTSVAADDTVTITWQYQVAGTLTATFLVVTKAGGTLGLTLQWKSATLNNQPVKRDGKTPVASQNPLGTGSGSATVPGFGPGAPWNFAISGDNACYATGSVTDPAGDTYTTGNWGPC